MFYYAVLNGNLVINTIISDSKENAELATRAVCVEYTTENPAGIGWTWDGSNFTAPVEKESTTVEEPTE